MSYTPTTWNTGDTITPSALNKIEQGIANAGGVVIIDDGTSLDKTYAEIYDLVESGTPCYISFAQEKCTSDLDSQYTYTVSLMPIVWVYKYDVNYRIMAVSNNTVGISTASSVGSPCFYTYSATNSSDYPVFYRKLSVSTQYLTVGTSR